MSQRPLYNKLVDLINKAKMEDKENKLNLLMQVKELGLKRDPSLLAEVIPMVSEFQTDFNPNVRKFVASFLRDVVRAYPVHVALVVPLASYLMRDDNVAVKKGAALLANTIYRPALQRLVEGGGAPGARNDWVALEGLRAAVLQTIVAGPADVSLVAIKFAESVVLACVGGRGLLPGASREGDKSVHRDLSASHPFLRGDMLDQAGRALVRQMVGWLEAGIGPTGANASSGRTDFSTGHYIALMNALQSLATNRAALFPDIVPWLASALELMVGGEVRGGSGRRGGASQAGSSGGAAAGSTTGNSKTVSKALQGASTTLRSVCLRLLKVAPSHSRDVQRLAEAAALAASDAEATAAVEGNSAIKGRIRLPGAARGSRGRGLGHLAGSGKVMALTPENRRAYADLAVAASQGKVPKPPPGYRTSRTPGFPLADLGELFGHVLNLLGPELMAAQAWSASSAAGNKRARSPAPEEDGEGKRRATENGKAVVRGDAKAEGDNVPPGANHTAPMEVESGSEEVKGAEVAEVQKVEPKSEPAPEPEPEPDPDPAPTARESLDSSRKAFQRVLEGWDGAAMEGKRGLHQRVVARLARMLGESEVALGSSDGATFVAEVIQGIIMFLTADYRKRYQAALALLTEMYATDVMGRELTFGVRHPVSATLSGVVEPEQEPKEETKEEPKEETKEEPKEETKESKGATRKRQRGDGFILYDRTLLALLTSLSKSLEVSSQQKLFTQTLLDCPRVPLPALELVCSLCDLASHPHDVQTGLVSLKDLIFQKPATRIVCIPAVLRFTHHADLDVRTKAVRLATNLLYPDPKFQPTVEAFAKEALASIKPSSEKKQEGEELSRQESSEPRNGDEQREEDVVDLEGNGREEEPDAASSHAGVGGFSGDSEKVSGSSSDVRVLGPWMSPPDTEASARVRLSLYFALCVKSRAMLSGLLEAYVTAVPSARKGLMAELQLLAKAAAKVFGESGVVALISAAPDGAQPMVLEMLDLLVPWETNQPSSELVAAVRRLRDTRVARAAAARRAADSGSDAKAEDVRSNAGIAYLVPILAGLGREGILKELPSLLQAGDDIVRAGFKRLTRPAKTATYTPVELIVLLNGFDHASAGVPVKRLTRALSLCLENKAVYNYPVLREALNLMSQPPPNERKGRVGGHEFPLLLMRTVIVAMTTFPELKNFVATIVLPRLVQQKVWKQPKIWDGFLRCAKLMARESGPTSFIAMLQLPEERLRDVLSSPDIKPLKEPLRRYAQTLVSVQPGVRSVLGMEAAVPEAT